MNHVIKAITFTPRTNGGNATCECGEAIHDEADLYDAWNTHRASQGLKPGDRMKAGAAKYSSTPWRAKGAMSIR